MACARHTDKAWGGSEGVALHREERGWDAVSRSEAELSGTAANANQRIDRTPGKVERPESFNG